MLDMGLQNFPLAVKKTEIQKIARMASPRSHSMMSMDSMKRLLVS